MPWLIPLLGIYHNQITQNMFNYTQISSLKYYLQFLPITRSSPFPWITSCVALRFLGESTRLVQIPKLNHISSYEIVFISLQTVIFSTPTCIPPCNVILLLHPSRVNIYSPTIWSELGHLARLWNISKYDTSLRLRNACMWVLLSLSRLETMRSHHELNLTCWRGHALKNQDTLVNSLPTPDMWLNPSWATQPQARILPALSANQRTMS